MLFVWLFIFKQVFYTTKATQQVCGLVRQIHGFGLIAIGQLLHHLYILLRQQIVGRIGALPHSLRYFIYRNGLGLGFTNTRLSLALG